MNTIDIKALEAQIKAHQQQHPKERTFSLLAPNQEQLWVKTPTPARLKALYRLTNWLMVCLNMPYFQAPPHAGGPGGKASLHIERQMLTQLHAAQVPVPQVIAYGDDWLALTSTGQKNLDMRLKELPLDDRYALWQQAVEAIADVHTKGCCLSQCFARNINLFKTWVNQIPQYKISFLDFEEDPTQIMTLAQAQARDWIFFLHSTATLLSDKTQAAQQFLASHILQENQEAQQAMIDILNKLKPLVCLKPFQWLGQDGSRLYQLGKFSKGLKQQLC